jgi:hypothetical protein
VSPWLLRAVERALVFFPSRPLQGTPAEVGLPFEDVAITTEDGERLHAWWIPGRRRLSILYLHGNGGNISTRLSKVEFLCPLDVSLLLVDYRGYGNSTGQPSEEGLARDARAAHRYLTRERGIPAETVVVWGESLGGAVAARLAAQEPAAGLILEAAFTSLSDMAPRAVPWVPFAGRLVRSHFDTLAWARGVGVPKLVIHGDEDEVVPFEMGREIYEKVSPPKRFLRVRGAQHNDVWFKGDGAYLSGLVEFLDALE